MSPARGLMWALLFSSLSACAASSSGDDVVKPGPIEIAIPAGPKSRMARLGAWGVNYWTWSPTYGDSVAGTESLVQAIAPAILRIGGYNNDANTPDPFDFAELDAAMAYVRAVGAEPLLQVPLLASVDGKPPSREDAAALVSYANVTKAYGIKYFSIGNEPDLYADFGSLEDFSRPAIAGFTPADYCKIAADTVASMKAVDSSIVVVGPDLAYKYRPSNDWLTPILEGCGSLFDVVAIHRYPMESAEATFDRTRADPSSFGQFVADARALMAAAGAGQKPLAVTETNLAWVDTPGVKVATGLNSVSHALWMADIIGISQESGLWTTAIWDVSDPDDWAMGLLDLTHRPRPAYHALTLWAGANNSTLLPKARGTSNISVHASRSAADDGTDAIIINWNSLLMHLSVTVTELHDAAPFALVTVPALSVTGIHVPDVGAPSASTYGPAQFESGADLEPLLIEAGR